MASIAAVMEAMSVDSVRAMRLLARPSAPSGTMMRWASEGYSAIQAQDRALALLGGLIGQARGLVPRLVASGVDRERHQFLVGATSDPIQNVQER